MAVHTTSSTPLAGYEPNHPWYYRLGGTIPNANQIFADIKQSGYEGYMSDRLYQYNGYVEPKRSQKLHQIKKQVMDDFKRDMERYRELASLLRAYRTNPTAQTEDFLSSCDDIFTSMSLKYCHLYNDLAHLLLIDTMLTQQSTQLSLL